MNSPNVFALNHSDLNAFLFSDVGIELNGSTLTTISVLARLGQDPWAEAARWARMPKPAAIECLAGSILRMPLAPQALAEAKATAARLILLLPSQGAASVQAGLQMSGISTVGMPRWLLAALVCGALALSVATTLLFNPAATGSTPTPTEQIHDR